MSNTILNSLLQMVQEFYSQTLELKEEQAECPRWYNRGYADGVIEYLKELGYREELSEFELVKSNPTEPDPQIMNRKLPWVSSYHRGVSKGREETYEVMRTDI